MARVPLKRLFDLLMTKGRSRRIALNRTRSFTTPHASLLMVILLNLSAWNCFKLAHPSLCVCCRYSAICITAFFTQQEWSWRKRAANNPSLLHCITTSHFLNRTTLEFDTQDSIKTTGIFLHPHLDYYYILRACAKLKCSIKTETWHCYIETKQSQGP